MCIWWTPEDAFASGSVCEVDVENGAGVIGVQVVVCLM